MFRFFIGKCGSASSQLEGVAAAAGMSGEYMELDALI